MKGRFFILLVLILLPSINALPLTKDSIEFDKNTSIEVPDVQPNISGNQTPPNIMDIGIMATPIYNNIYKPVYKEGKWGEGTYDRTAELDVSGITGKVLTLNKTGGIYETSGNWTIYIDVTKHPNSYIYFDSLERRGYAPTGGLGWTGEYLQVYGKDGTNLSDVLNKDWVKMFPTNNYLASPARFIGLRFRLNTTPGTTSPGDVPAVVNTTIFTSPVWQEDYTLVLNLSHMFDSSGYTNYSGLPSPNNITDYYACASPGCANSTAYLVPPADYNGPVSYQVTACDNMNNCASSKNYNWDILPMNDAPKLKSVQATPNPVSKEGTITFTANNYSDIDLDSLTLYCKHEDVPTPSYYDCMDNDDSDGLSCSYTAPNSSGQYFAYCIVFDGSKSSTAQMDYYRVNAKPKAVNITIQGIQPNNRITDHTPRIAWDFIDSNDQNQSQYEVQVRTETNGGGSVMGSVSNSGQQEYWDFAPNWPLNDGEDYFVRVRVDDSFEWSEWNETQIHMNSLPTIDFMDIEPATAYANSTLFCNVTSNDDDGDSVEETYKWFADSVLIAGENNSILDCGSVSECEKNVQITCNVTVDDSYEQGESRESSLTIENFVPHLISDIPDMTWEQMEGASFNISNYFYDIEDTLEYSVSGNNNINININNITGNVTLNSTFPWHGSEQVTFHATDGQNQGSSNTVNLTVTQVFESTTVELDKGWNLFSLPVKPTDVNGTSVNITSDEILQKADSIYSYEDKYLPHNQSFNLSIRDSYMIHLPAKENISIFGMPFQSFNISLTEGWNFINYPSENGFDFLASQSSSIEQIAAIEDSKVIRSVYDTNIHNYSYKKGQGLMVYSSGNDEITFNP